MTDFLARLAERSLGVGEVVRPRPASLFEPRDRGEPAALEEEVEVEAGAPAPAVRGRQRQPPAAPQDFVALSHEVEQPPQPSPTRVSVAELASPPAPTAGPDAEPGPAASSPIVVPAVELEQPVAAPTRTRVARSATRVPDTGDAQSSSHPPPPPGKEVVRTAVPVDPLPPRTRERARGSEPQSPLARAAPDLPPVDAPMSLEADRIPPATRPAPAVAARPRGDAREPEPPVVHVTIGRVDVRAVLPAAAPPERPAQRRRPRMTLDEYLRDGGRR